MPFNHQNARKSGKITCTSEDYGDNASVFLNKDAARPNNSSPSDCFEDGMSAKYIIDLDMLSVEQEERTKETQNLQEVVEQASRLALERMGPIFCHASTSSDNISAKNTTGGFKEYGIFRHQSISQSVKCDADLNKTRYLSFPGRDVLEHAIEEYSQQVSDLQRQLREAYELHEQQKFNFRQTIIELQTKLHENRTEKDSVVDFRLNECGKQSELMGRLQELVQEQRSLKQAAAQKRVEAEDQGKALTRRAEAAEQALQDVFTRLADFKRRRGKSDRVSCDGSFRPSEQQLGPVVEKELQDLENENHDLQKRLRLMEELLKDGQGRMECLLKEHSEREQVERQVVLHQTKMSDQEPALDSLDSLRSVLLQEHQTHKIKVSELEEVLVQALSQAEQAQRERDLSLQQAEELDAQLGRLTTELHQMAEELSRERKQRQQLCERDAGTIQSLRSKLEQRHLAVQQLEKLLCSLREECQRHLNIQMSADTEQKEAQSELEQLWSNIEQLQQAKDEALQVNEQGTEEAVRLHALLDERDQKLWLQEEESRRCRTQAELLSLKLEDAEGSRELLRGSLEALQEEHSGLNKQLEQLCQDNQQLKGALQEAEARLKTEESEKSQLQATLSERSRCLHQLTLEKQQAITQLDAQRVNLVKLKEEQKTLKEQHSSNHEELQAHNSKLKAQLTSTQMDLERAKTSLRALAGADGHGAHTLGLKVALDMQKRITAKRQQIDFLQSRIQILEETTEKLAQEKHYQAMESKRLAQELSFERESRRRLEAEMETLHRSEELLKSKTERLDKALHKMSDGFSECQEFIQKQEQAIMRLKLQHALELKELQGQNTRATGSTNKSPITSPTLRPTFQNNSNNEMERPSSALQLRSLVKELRCVIDETQDPHTRVRASMRSAESPKNRKCGVTEDTEGPRKETKRRDSYMTGLQVSSTLPSDL